MVWPSHGRGSVPLEIASVLLAAGRGKRLRPLTDRVAKPGLPVLDVPLATFGLTRLIEEAPPVVVNLSHLPETVTEPVGEVVSPASSWTTFVEEPEALGTAGTLAALADRMASTVVIYNADLVSDLSARELLATHRASGAAATLAVRKVGTGADLLIEGNTVTGFVDRRKTSGASGALYLGVAALERTVIEAIPQRVPLGLGETVLPELAARGELAIALHDSYALDVGTPARYLEVTMDLLHGRGPNPPCPWPGDIVEVADGLAYVGEGAEVDVVSLYDGAVILRDAVIEPGARVAGSIVWAGERVPRDARLDGVIWFEGDPLMA